MSNYFIELAKINVSEHVEKKGNFSYLSWTFAVHELRKQHPDATWIVKRFDDKPFMKTELGYFVEVAVTVNNIELSQIHPVLDNRNKPIEKPSPFHINTSIQRCLVKAIALHGLGLYIYSGEDLPTEKEPPKLATKEQIESIESKCVEYIELRGTGTTQQLLDHLKISDLNKITEMFANKSVAVLDAMIKKANEDNDTKTEI